MTSRVWRTGPIWAPLAALALLVGVWGRDVGAVVLVVMLIALAGAVLAAVHHAETIAHRVGEPFGSLVLAVAVTVIEVSLIVVLMVSSESGKPSLARDTVFSAVMITLNGIVGLCLVVATWRRPVVKFHPAGTGAALAAITTLAALSLVLPTFTTSTPGPTFSTTQLVFAALSALAIYAVFVVMQTYRHREYFQPVEAVDRSVTPAPAARPTPAWIPVTLLLAALVAVVGLGKSVSGPVESAVVDAGMPVTVVAVAIAAVVLLPETLAAVRAARRRELQTSFNLAYGSAMASIGLTIPAVAVASWIIGTQLELGLSPVEMVLLAVTVAVSTLTVTPGRATMLQGTLHLAIFAGFAVLAFSP